MGGCVEDNVLAMEYLDSEEYPGYTKNIKLINKINKYDLIVAYLNEKRIGGIGRVTRTRFDAVKPYKECGDDGFRQRIRVKWINVFKNNYPTIQNFKEVFGNKNLHTATIHQISKIEFNKIRSLINEEKFIEESVSLESKEEIIDDEKEKEIEQKVDSILPKDPIKKKRKYNRC